MDDFGTDFATDIVELFTAGTNITAPASVFITLYDGAGNELNASLQNGRVSVSVPGGWSASGSAFDNDAEINFGEATADITVQEFAIKDSDADDATATEFFRAPITDAPQDFADGTRVFFAAGDLDVDILD
jgi:hypothetical protein